MPFLFHCLGLAEEGFSLPHLSRLVQRIGQGRSCGQSLKASVTLLGQFERLLAVFQSPRQIADRQVKVAEIDRGILLLLGIQKADTSQNIEKLLNKTLAYRIFGDHKDHMNLSLTDVKGDLLVVSQFTLAADTKKGLRPSFSTAAPPELAERLYDEFVELARVRCGRVETGVFGADMKVSLLNDGPVTFLLEA